LRWTFYISAALLAATWSAALPSDAGQGGERHWLAPSDAVKRTNPIAPAGRSIARGQKLYDRHCASCHGVRGAGDGPAGQTLPRKPANLQAKARQHTDGDLAWKIATGRDAMPGWSGMLSEQDIWHVVNYLRSLGKKRVGPQTEVAPDAPAPQ
jgi:mono/diheme cytochrome c family protein